MQFRYPNCLLILHRHPGPRSVSDYAYTAKECKELLKNVKNYAYIAKECKELPTNVKNYVDNAKECKHDY